VELDGRRMLPSARQIDAVARTFDLLQPLRPAADSTDLLADCRTCASGLAFAAQRAQHERIIV
jgi:hypothetical protein